MAERGVIKISNREKQGLRKFSQKWEARYRELSGTAVLDDDDEEPSGLTLTCWLGIDARGIFMGIEKEPTKVTQALWAKLQNLSFDDLSEKQIEKSWPESWPAENEWIKTQMLEWKLDPTKSYEMFSAKVPLEWAIEADLT